MDLVDDYDTGLYNDDNITKLDNSTGGKTYRITLWAAGITDVAGNELDGDGDGTGGDNWVYGETAGQDDMLVPILGDGDLDGDVDFFDYMPAKGNFGMTDAVWQDGDFDYDGEVTFFDYLTAKGNFLQSVTR